MLFRTGAYAIVAALMLLLASEPASASADSTCYPEWAITNASDNCANLGVISPGNDSRVNLFLLLSDRYPQSDRISQPDNGWEDQFGETYFNWRILSRLWRGDPDREYPEFYGTRCGSYVQGTQDFEAALKAARGISPKDRITLIESRFALYAICELRSGGSRYSWQREEPEEVAPFSMIQADVAPGRAREFLLYLNGAGAFYSEQFARAQTMFKSLKNAKDPWVREASRYMLGRVAVNLAQANANDKWGYFDPGKADRQHAIAAEAAFKAYLKDYPKGRYAASASGLVRRAYWLSRDFGKLARAYYRALGSADLLADRARLIEEIDNNLLYAHIDPYAEEISAPGYDEPPMLRAARLLLQIRFAVSDDEPKLKRAFITGQKDQFGTQTALYEFILANYDFYIAHDYRSVLTLIPDAARQEDFSYLQFSRQALRGHALAMLEDRNEGGFWRDMLGGSKARYQQAVVELGLASFYERNGQLDRVFAPASPITKPVIRNILLTTVAGPDMLRRVVDNDKRPQNERDVALFTLFYKQLSRGYYGAFVRDSAQRLKGAGNSDAWVGAISYQQDIPLGLFSAGKRSENIDCPALVDVARALAANKQDYKGRLCLGDFWRRNGFDYFDLRTRGRWRWLDRGENASPVLGSSEELFPGEQIPRQQFYQDIIADKAAPAKWRSYALYRAVRCYAPSGGNSCGGEDVTENQRRDWFRELKRRYPESRWAKELKYYW
ncbi:MAG: hypothetical protein AAFX04_04435 [Pseudomonadota bacterium]